ncbi:MAG: hypothetical protein KDE09_20505 [Anaerolineales bacterium]|nr:hypothetical protein [Anaerolineales bacterium]
MRVRASGRKVEKGNPERVASGAYGDVWLYGDALADYRQLQRRNDQTSVREARTLERYFERYAEKGPVSLDSRMFKQQGRERDAHGNEVLIFAFKSYQFRIYGSVRDYKGRRAFVGTACENSKKTNKANPQILAKAARKSSEVM